MMLMPSEFLYYALLTTCLLIPMGLGIIYSMDFFDNLFDKTDDT